MSGLIFRDSKNLYQDQAKVLFNYYKQAAEKIVHEEMELESLIQKAENELRSMETDYPAEIARQEQKIKTMTLIGYLTCIVLVGIGILIWVSNSLKPQLARFIDEANNATNQKKQQINELKRSHSNIRRDYKVNKLGVVYVPVASHIPFEDKNFVLDFTGSVPDLGFTLSSLKQPESIKENVVELKSLIENVPLVESSEDVEMVDTSEYSTSMQEAPLYDFMGAIDRHMRNLGFMLRDVNRVSVSLPIITPESPEMAFLKKHGTTDTGNAPVCQIFDLQAHNSNIEAFEKLNDMKKGLDDSSGEFIEFFKGLMAQLAESAQILTQMKVSCSNKVLQYSNAIFMNTLRTSFNHYSPLLEADEIERIRTTDFNFQDSVGDYTPFVMNPSSRMRYDLFSQNWVADDNSRSSFPFGVHQIHEEVLMPVISNLMEETRIERLKIYNHIQDQKLDYLNQWHRDTEDFYGRNRAESNDLINRMRETFAEYSSSLNTLKALQETEKQMGESGKLDSSKVQAKSNQAETLATFELQGNQFMQQQEDFMDYMDRLKEDIDAQAEKFGFIEYFEASLRDKEVHQMALASDNLQDIEPRRKGLIGAGAHFATLSDIPPEPKIEPKAYEDFTMNLIQMADDALKSLDNDDIVEEEVAKPSGDLTIPPPTNESPAELQTPEPPAPPASEPSSPEPAPAPQTSPQKAAPPAKPLPAGQASYAVVLNNLGDKAETALFTISELLEISVDEARELCSTTPVNLVFGWSLEDAIELFNELEKAGVVAEIAKED